MSAQVNPGEYLILHMADLATFHNSLGICLEPEEFDCLVDDLRDINVLIVWELPHMIWWELSE
jgi:hypothetical protein